ncbi:IQ and ubiquitin-like domain-containing protein isoform X2 [Pseudomyrmex gracilis]|uniref:IQ and ubiquitin-like domain-containing protein isoform X2 n=1 Tax=Pseudomyrmex gracilis TaxID=219809 RepID=UPI0009958851|nr:IQ and ubiquitin-like domain-containing protein isoform X2 [Pseudomyrmex gracilis]
MVLSNGIEDQKIPKPYLGGWRHKITGIEYVNAASQTGPPPRQISRNNVCSRAVQCVQTKDGVTQSLRHRATQMWRNDCNISNEMDKYVTVKPYKTWRNLDEQARIIQRNYRAYKLSKYTREYAQTYRTMLEQYAKHEEEKAIANKMRHKQNILRQIYPRSRADFDMLYSLIEKWRFDRLKDVKSRFFKAAQRAEGYRILEKTVEMFNHIDKRKQVVKSSRRKQRVLRFLTLNCKSSRWIGYKGQVTEMITLRTQKAREFKGFYDALSNRDIGAEERKKLLIKLKQSLGMHICNEAIDLLYLLDQEIALLNREMKNLSLDYLNERITYSYVNFVKMHSVCGCECVDEISESSELREPLEIKTKFCRSCFKLVPYDKFLSHTRTNKLLVCANCSSLSRRNIAHINFDPYVFILNYVRTEEERRGSVSFLAFMMQEHDIYHLVNNIWRGQSVVSKNQDLFFLRLVRYKKDIEWSPWNCILLTENEADAHCHINDPATVYSKHLINQINLAHQIAKNYFKRLIIFEKEFRESCRSSTLQ